MKKIRYILPITLSLLPTIAISSCSCNINPGYIAIPSSYLNIDGTKLIGFKDPEVDLSKYDTLQVPSNVTSVSGFNDPYAKKAYKSIINVIGDNNGKWTTIESLAFSSLPSLTKITLPKTISNIGINAFSTLLKLNTIDLSNLTDISIIKSNQFNGCVDPTKQVNNGTIIVSNNDHKNTLTNTFKDNEWLKGWNIVVKQ